MKHWIGGLVFSFIVLKVAAQKGLENMIQAERNFAAYALQHNTKSAFLQFMDSTSIEIKNGKPVNGLQLWANRQEDSTVLKWHPQYAEIAASNDFGYTTGPWTFQKSTQDTVSARGQFTTVWHLNKYGEWKFLIDMGTNYKIINNAQTVQKIAATGVRVATLQSMIYAEESFDKAAALNSPTAYGAYLSSKSIINHNNHLPAILPAEQSALINSLPINITYKPLGEGLATSGDLGYIYGSIISNNKSSAYLHIWRHEKNGWRLALEVLQL
jgi:hypothetical protein